MDDLGTADRLDAAPALEGSIWALHYEKVTKNTDFH
jgi:hypothetical protein